MLQFLLTFAFLIWVGSAEAEYYDRGYYQAQAQQRAYEAEMRAQQYREQARQRAYEAEVRAQEYREQARQRAYEAELRAQEYREQARQRSYQSQLNSQYYRSGSGSSSQPVYSRPEVIYLGPQYAEQIPSPASTPPRRNNPQQFVAMEGGWYPIESGIVAINGQRVPAEARFYRTRGDGSVEFQIPYQTEINEWVAKWEAADKVWYDKLLPRLKAKEEAVAAFEKTELAGLSDLLTETVKERAKALAEEEIGLRRRRLQALQDRVESERKIRADFIVSHSQLRAREGSKQKESHSRIAQEEVNRQKLGDQETENLLAEAGSKYVPMSKILSQQDLWKKWSKEYSASHESWYQRETQKWASTFQNSEATFKNRETRQIQALKNKKLVEKAQANYDGEVARRGKVTEEIRKRIEDQKSARLAFMDAEVERLLLEFLDPQAGNGNPERLKKANQEWNEFDVATAALWTKEETKRTADYLPVQKLVQHEDFFAKLGLWKDSYAKSYQEWHDEQVAKWVTEKDSELTAWSEVEKKGIAELTQALIKLMAEEEFALESTRREKITPELQKRLDDELKRRLSFLEEQFTWIWSQYANSETYDVKARDKRWAEFEGSYKNFDSDTEALWAEEEKRRKADYFGAVAWATGEKELEKQFLAQKDQSQRDKEWFESSLARQVTESEAGRRDWHAKEVEVARAMTYPQVRKVGLGLLETENKRRTAVSSSLEKKLQDERQEREKSVLEREKTIITWYRKGKSIDEISAEDARMVDAESARRDPISETLVKEWKTHEMATAAYPGVKATMDKEIARYPLDLGLPKGCEKFLHGEEVDGRRSLALKKEDGKKTYLAKQVAVRKVACVGSSIALIFDSIDPPVEGAKLVLFHEGRQTFLYKTVAPDLVASDVAVTQDGARVRIWLEEGGKPMKDFLHEVRWDGSNLDAVPWEER